MKTDHKFMQMPDYFIVLKELNVNFDITMSDISNKTKINYVHLHYIKKVLLDKEFITETFVKPNKFIYVTEKGQELIKIIDMLLDKLDIDKDKLLEYRESMKRKKVPEVEKDDINNKGI